MSRSSVLFSKSAHCPVVERVVRLTGARVSLPGAGPSEVTRKSCSNVEACLQLHGSLANVPTCLLHSLQGY